MSKTLVGELTMRGHANPDGEEREAHSIRCRGGAVVYNAHVIARSPESIPSDHAEVA